MNDNEKRIHELQEQIFLLRAADELGLDAIEELEHTGKSDREYTRPELDAALQKAIKKHRSISRWKRYRPGKREVVVASAVVLFGLSLLLPVQALKIQIINLFMRDEKVSMHFYAIETEKEMRDAGFIFMPAELPNGYKLQYVDKDRTIKQAHFTNNVGEIILFQQASVDRSVQLDSENNYREIAIKGCPAYCTQVKGYTSVFWEQEGYYLQLSGYLDVELLVKAAESTERL